MGVAHIVNYAMKNVCNNKKENACVYVIA